MISLPLSAYLMIPFSVSINDCAEYMVYNLLRPEHKTGPHFISNKGDETSVSRYFENQEVRNKVWDHAVGITGLEERRSRV
jgi:hypothetical protein